MFKSFGLIGQWLNTLGNVQVEALDISKGILDIARKKNLYTDYHHLTLGERL